jgi:hypothetical protein
VTLMVAQNQRFLPSHQAARAIIASGELGRGAGRADGLDPALGRPRRTGTGSTTAPARAAAP